MKERTESFAVLIKSNTPSPLYVLFGKNPGKSRSI